MKEFKDKVMESLAGAKNVVFVGIGEEKMTDDGVGPYIISELLDFSNERFKFINAGTDMMNRIDEIIEFNPTHIVLIDTCTVNSPPGTCSILRRDNIVDFVPISSHTIPVQIVIDLIAEKLQGVDIFMIGIVPESLDGFTELRLYKQDELSLDERSDNIDLPFFDIQLTDTIKKVADQLIIMIKDIINTL